MIEGRFIEVGKAATSEIKKAGTFEHRGTYHWRSVDGSLVLLIEQPSGEGRIYLIEAPR